MPTSVNKDVSTRSRPKAAGQAQGAKAILQIHVSTRSRPKAAGCGKNSLFVIFQFQHAAARRRLAPCGSRPAFRKHRFNTQPPEGGWQRFREIIGNRLAVSTRSRPKAAGFSFGGAGSCTVFQHAAARRRLGIRPNTLYKQSSNVFQHAAARRRLGNRYCLNLVANSFNTQPPEGGWLSINHDDSFTLSFNTQPPEGGWKGFDIFCLTVGVSTRSRPKAAGNIFRPLTCA